MVCVSKYSDTHKLFIFCSYSSRDYMSSRDSRDYAPAPRDYPYREYSGHSSSRDEYGSGSRGYRCVKILRQMYVMAV